MRVQKRYMVHHHALLAEQPSQLADQGGPATVADEMQRQFGQRRPIVLRLQNPANSGLGNLLGREPRGTVVGQCEPMQEHEHVRGLSGAEVIVPRLSDRIEPQAEPEDRDRRVVFLIVQRGLGHIIAHGIKPGHGPAEDGRPTVRDDGNTRPMSKLGTKAQNRNEQTDRVFHGRR